MKNKFLPLVFSAALLMGGAISIFNNKEVVNTHAYEDLSIQSSGDAFVLLDKSFDADESFVYTGELYFNNDGQAGGLVFGGTENVHYYVLNLDRYENHIKLMEFNSNGQGGYDVATLNSCDFIGNSVNVKQGEWDFINPRVRTISNVNLKVVVTREDEHAYAEFFVEGIKRFGIDTTIDLNADGTYVGGQLGLNCFNSISQNHIVINIIYNHSLNGLTIQTLYVITMVGITFSIKLTHLVYYGIPCSGDTREVET